MEEHMPEEQPESKFMQALDAGARITKIAIYLGLALLAVACIWFAIYALTT